MGVKKKVSQQGKSFLEGEQVKDYETNFFFLWNNTYSRSRYIRNARMKKAQRVDFDLMLTFRISVTLVCTILA